MNKKISPEEALETIAAIKGVKSHSKKSARISKFKKDLLIFGIISIMLIIINFMTNTNYWWFPWPMLGMGIGLAFAAVKTFVRDEDDDDK